MYIITTVSKVLWVPPCHLSSFCQNDLTHRPYEPVTCFLKFGSWTYDDHIADLNLYHNVCYVSQLTLQPRYNYFIATTLILILPIYLDFSKVSLILLIFGTYPHGRSCPRQRRRMSSTTHAALSLTPTSLSISRSRESPSPTRSAPPKLRAQYSLLATNNTQYRIKEFCIICNYVIQRNSDVVNLKGDEKKFNTSVVYYVTNM